MEHLDPEIIERLRAYENLIRHWAPRLDLVSPADLPRLWDRHIVDSLRALPLVEVAPAGACVDVGSGAGLPGVPLAIASGRSWRLIEPRHKRAGFLDEVVRELSLDRCEVVRSTAQQAAHDPALSAAHAIATARALAPPPEAVERCRPLVTPGGSILLFVGANREIPLIADEVEPGLLKIDIYGL